MAVYVDNMQMPWRGMIMSHMTADTNDELHAMAAAIGLKREWFQGLPKHSIEHYDVSEGKRQQAIKLGAIEEDLFDEDARKRRQARRRLNRQLMARNKKVLAPVGVFTCDPGTTSGLSWGVYKLDEDAPSVFDLVARDIRMAADVPLRDPGPGATWHEAEWAAADIIQARIRILHGQWLKAGIPSHRQFWCFEDFILYPDRQHTSDRSGLSPVRMTALLHGRLHDINHELQYRYAMASEAKGFATNERLKQHGLWVRGEPEHHRDAKRHAVLHVSKLLQSGVTL